MIFHIKDYIKIKCYKKNQMNYIYIYIYYIIAFIQQGWIKLIKSVSKDFALL